MKNTSLGSEEEAELEIDVEKYFVFRYIIVQIRFIKIRSC